jgi:CheY-like chemotaxis protein
MLQKNILIVTPHAEFGGILSQSLAKEASSDVKVATSISEAQTKLKKSNNLSYALLDMDLGVEKVMEIGFSFRNTFPQISLILISKRIPPTEMEDLRPWKYLQKPFVQKDLLDLIQDKNSSNTPRSEFVDTVFRVGEVETVPVWYKDEVRATKNLVAAISNLNVQEAILVSSTEILAYSGELSKDAIEECSNLVRKCWGENNTAELIKPIRLKTTNRDHLLSATMVAVGIILALTFDGETPFTIMRSQTRYLTNVLKNPQLTLPDVHLLPKTPEIQVAKRPLPLASIDLTSSNDVIQSTSAINPVPDKQSDGITISQERTSTQKVCINVDPFRNPDFGELRTMQQVCAASETKGRLKDQMGWTIPPQQKDGSLFHHPSFVVRENPQFEGNSTMGEQGKLPHHSLSPVNTSLFDVYYACLLIPRIKDHTLDGDCANYLRGELPNIFLGYGWRLEEVILNPSYMEWLVRIPPTIAPAAHIKVIRNHSSQLILTNYSRFTRNEFLKDFWSPGYLLGCGKSLIPEAEIAEFISINRKQYYSEGNLLFDQRRNIPDCR